MYPDFVDTLYFKKTSTQALQRNTRKDFNWICAFHVGFVAIKSSTVLLTKEDIWPPSVSVIRKSYKTREVI